MGILKWLGIVKDTPSLIQKESFPAIGESNATSDQRPMFGTEEKFIEQGFYRVLKQTNIPEDVQDALYVDYKEAHWSGSPRGEEKSFEEHLFDLNWNWPEFDKWEKTFSKDNVWPYMWSKYPEIYGAQPFSSNNVGAELKHLRISEMKKIAKAHGATNLQKRDELEKFIFENVSMGEIREAVPGRIEEQIQKFERKKKIGLCKLLSGSVSATVYSLRDAARRKKVANSKYFKNRKLRAVSAGCPVEERFATKYNDGKLKKSPPFFPGDRTYLNWKSHRDMED